MMDPHISMRREPKPDWAEVPAALRAQIEDILGAHVTEADIAWGGFSPSASYRLGLSDGRRAFAKGTHPGQTESGHKMMMAEMRSYRDLAPLGDLSCGYIGAVNEGDWHILLLEQLVDARMLDGSRMADIHAFLTRYLAFQQACSALQTPPDWLVHGKNNPLVDEIFLGTNCWDCLDDADSMNGFVSLFEDQQAARNWADAIAGAMIERQHHMPELTAEATPEGVLHVDVRSDNILILPDGTARLIDWPNTCTGPLAVELAGWLPSLMAEGGPAPEKLLQMWEEQGGPQIDLAHLTTALTGISGYFMENCWKPCPAPLPRLRWIQKRQFFAILPWLCQAMDLPQPPAALPYE